MLLELHDIHKSYELGQERLEVLSGLDLAVQPGQSLAVVGVSGCGKSTLLNIIAGLDAPTRGSVSLGGTELTRLGPGALAATRNRSIGLVFQMHHLLPQCTVLENVLVPTLAASRSARKAAPARAAMLLERLGVGELAHRRPSQLSGGQCQRVAVARALINRPALLLADEPTGALDAQSSATLAELLAELRGVEELAVIVATHSTTLAGRMGRVLKLSQGRLEETDGHASA